MTKLSIVTGCHNEEDNIPELVKRLHAVMANLPKYNYEIIIIDNASTDNTPKVLRQIAENDKKVKVIYNTRNFGPIRSGYHAFLQAKGDVVVLMASDLQDPPELIPKFLEKWEEGYKITLAIKNSSRESLFFFLVRKMFYSFINKISENRLIKNGTGFGAYDQQVLRILRQIDDPYPYFRGLICELGFDIAPVYFEQPARKRGFTKNNFYTLYDLAILGVINHSKLPLRIATFAGFILAFLSLLMSFIYLGYKLVLWDNFQVGMAPLVSGLFFFSSVQLFFIGIVGEYVGAIHTQVQKRPLVIEKGRLNFEDE
ncbi:MAG: glycosyltransferase family 2 protein [Oligoflexales bacterium]|nr:glycosyltransferase family 2 protein [Oligoflexales bacterium]